MRNESSSSSSTVEWWWWGRWKKSFYYFYGRTRFYSIFSFFLCCCSFVHKKMVFCWWKYRTWPFTQNTGTTTALRAHNSSVATKMKNENWQKSCSCQEQNELSCENNLELQYLWEVDSEGGKEAETETLHIKIEDSNFSLPPPPIPINSSCKL